MTLPEGPDLELPDDVGEASVTAAHALDELFGRGLSVRDERAHTQLLEHRDALLHHLGSLTDRIVVSIDDLDTSHLSIGWPDALYIPAGADWRTYWIVPPDDGQRYGLEWASPPPPAGYGEASKGDGTIYCFQRIRTVDRSARSEAAIGILFSPERTLSVVSLQPDVECVGDDRWFQMIDSPVAGSTHVRVDLVLAAWQQIPGSSRWDLSSSKAFTVYDVGPRSGSGFQAITPYRRSFDGASLATPFLVQRGRTYLFGVVGRVNVSSTLTDANGQRLPLIEDGTFRVYGSLACRIPRMNLVEQQVHIP